MGSRLIHAFILVIALLGFWQVSIAGTFYAKAWLASRLIDSAWQQTLNGEEKVRPWPWADTWPIAELSIPRLGIRHVILLGDNGRVLAFGPGLTEGLSLPGESGLSVVSGHRDTSFRFLQAIKKNDEIIIHTTAGKFHYTVEDSAVVDQRYTGIDPKITNTIQKKLLMLVTCFPFDAIRAGGNLRYVVLASAR